MRQAMDLAREFGITLVGFTRNEGFNIYASGERVLVSARGRD